MTDFFRIEPAFAGHTVVILANGASFTAKAARHVAIARLEDRCRVIAVNDTIYPAWWADWLHATDAKWWRWHIQSVQHFRGIKTALVEGLPPPWGVGLLRNTGKEGFDPDADACRNGGSSGYAAIHCAIHAGAKRILLVGLDLSGERWFGRHPDGLETDYAIVMAPSFPTIIPAAIERGVRIINCSLDSSLTCFPKLSLEEALP